VQVSTIVISKLSIHIDSVPYNFQEIEIVVLDCHKLSLHVAHVDHERLHPEQIKSVVQEEQTTQWPKEKVQKDKQSPTKLKKCN
jgi:hypothetical protein